MISLFNSHKPFIKDMGSMGISHNNNQQMNIMDTILNGKFKVQHANHLIHHIYYFNCMKLVINHGLKSK